jgi:hypothetical protein
MNRIIQDLFFFFSSFHLPAIATRPPRQARMAGVGRSGEAGGDETGKTQSACSGNSTHLSLGQYYKSF